MKSQSDRISHSAQSNLLRRLRTSARNMAIGVQLAGTIGLLGGLGGAIVPAAQAQTAINALKTSTTSGTPTPVNTTVARPANTGTGNYGAAPYVTDPRITLDFATTTLNDRKIDTFSTGSGSAAKTYNFGGLVGNIYIRRNYDDLVGIANSASQPPVKIGNRQLGFFERGSSLTNIVSSYASDMETILRSQTINRGTDNLFANRNNGSGNNNNIERVDFVIQSGLIAPAAAQISDIGFLVLERGGNDTVKVAAITSIDGNGTPTSYGPVKFASSWGASGISLLYSVMRKDPADPNNPNSPIDPDWRPSDTNTQSITGIYFSLNDLGVTPGTTIYGYSVIPADVTAASGAGLLNWNSYPMTTTESGSGIDLMAGGGIFVTHTISGTVFSDPNGSQVQDGTETLLSLGLNAVLLDFAGNVLKSQAVAADGTYKFSGVATPSPTDPYTVILTTATVGSPGSAAPSIVLPTGYVSTGENKGGTVDTAIDTKITVSSSDFTPVAGQSSAGQSVLTEAVKMNFGIEQLPTAKTTTIPSQANPGGTTSVTVSPALFNTSTDPDGTVDKYRITAFPTNATSFTITQGGTTTTYTSANFPAAGLTILPTELATLNVDPNVDGAVDVTIPFKAIDNVGKESANTANAIVPFTAGTTGTPPELILLKRITNINGGTIGKKTDGTPIDLTLIVAQPDNLSTPRDESGDATNPNWTSNYPKGAIDGGMIKSGDRVEYTIYFLSAGGQPVTNANFCDWVPKNTTFVPDSYGVGQGIQLAIGSLLNTFTNVPDSDRGVFYNPGATPPAAYPNANTFKLNCMSPAGTDGAVVVNLVNNTLTAPANQLPNATAAGTPGNSYGFVRFVSKVK